jgi:ubiquinone/menaquinone biosynthesis C-methylase UbiE
MDKYTEDVKIWLDQRFRAVDEKGIFIGHQPIYGFRKGSCEAGLLERYIVTYQIIKAFAKLSAETLVDIGGAEGYKAFLAKKLLAMKVRTADLSGEAAIRAKELFDLDADEIDSHGLPYPDESFDVVLSSESLEHVKDYRASLAELIRISRKYIVITVPHDPPELVRKNIEEKIPHAHIHVFDTSTFDFLREQGFEVHVQRTRNPWIQKLAPFIDAEPLSGTGSRSKMFYKAFNSLTPLFRLLFGKRTVQLLMKIDELLCERFNGYLGILVVICKNGGTIASVPEVKVEPKHILETVVPYHYLKIK